MNATVEAPVIPDAALENHIAILGKTGSGKSNAAKTVVERLLDAGERVCVIDPTGTWWGLRLQPDGRPSRYGVVIFGGHHADVAVRAQDGAAIAEVVGTSATSCIIDTRLMTVGERTRFFTDFAEALLRANRGRLTLVLDEAHVFAPQGKIADPRSGAMLHAANNLVSLGRGLGLSIVMISQRAAKLHNDSLGQVETLVAMRVILPHDRSAIDDWLKEQVSGADRTEAMRELSALPTGDAFVWSPGLGLFQRRHFPLARTMDTGTARANTQDTRLEPLDLAAITERLAQVAAEVVANDPRTLKARIAELERAVRDPAPDAETIATAARAEGREDGYATGYDAGYRLGWFAGAEEMNRLAVRAVEASMAPEPFVPAPTAPPPRATPVIRGGGGTHVVRIGAGGTASGTAGPSTAAARPSDGEAKLTGALQKILDALAYREQLTRTPGLATDKAVLGFLVGMASGGGGFNNYLGKLRSGGFIAYPRPGAVELTAEGRALAQAPQLISDEDVQRQARDKLPPAQQKIFDVVVSVWPDGLAKTTLAHEIGMEPGGGGFNNYLGRMRSMLLIEYPQPGTVRATDYLFPQRL